MLRKTPPQNILQVIRTGHSIISFNQTFEQLVWGIQYCRRGGGEGTNQVGPVKPRGGGDAFCAAFIQTTVRRGDRGDQRAPRGRTAHSYRVLCAEETEETNGPTGGGGIAEQQRREQRGKLAANAAHTAHTRRL